MTIYQSRRRRGRSLQILLREDLGTVYLAVLLLLVLVTYEP